MRVLCKDGHFRKFNFFIHDIYYLECKCTHCKRMVMTVPHTAGSGFRRRKLKSKNHTCKARIKELPKIRRRKG